MNLHEVLGRARSAIPGCLAAGRVDMTTGMLLAAKTVDARSRAQVDLVAAAAADLFRGSDVSAIENLLKRAQGVDEDGAPYFQEIIVSSEGLLHVFVRSIHDTEKASVFVCRDSANIGMVLGKARASANEIESAE